MNPQQPYQQQPSQQGYSPPPPGYQQPGYPSQPGYSGQPGYPPQQAYQQPAASQNRWGPSSIGMESHVAAGLSYLSMFFLGPIIPIVFFIIEKQNRFVKFHAAQGILLSIVGAILGVAWFVGAIILGAGATAAAANDSTGAASAGAGFGLLILGCLVSLVGILLFVATVWGIVAGFSGKYTKMPLIGNIAERWAGGPATPLY